MRTYIWLTSTSVSIVCPEKRELQFIPWSGIRDITDSDCTAIVRWDKTMCRVVKLEPAAAEKLSHNLYSIGVPDKPMAYVGIEEDQGIVDTADPSIPF